MKAKLLMSALLLLGMAATASASYEWTRIGCHDTYEMSAYVEDLIPCAISQSTGGGGSNIITDDGQRCIKIVRWMTGGNFRLHAKLLEANCITASDNCYRDGAHCEGWVDWGDFTSLYEYDGFDYAPSVIIGYQTSEWGPVDFFHTPTINGMDFKARFVYYASRGAAR